MICKNTLVKTLLKLKPVYAFSNRNRKGIEENIKQKQISNSSQNNANSPVSSQDLAQVSKMKFLNMQFFPVSLLLTPCLFKFQCMYDPYFLLGEVMAQKYLSVALLLNLDPNADKTKMALILTAMASIHALTGFYSIGTPFGMALLSILSPFKFCGQKQRYSDLEADRMKTMTNIRMIYFFLFVFLAILKGYHYEEIWNLEKKLQKFNKQNLGLTSQIDLEKL